MTEKIQMTEEQFDKFMDECFDCSPHYMKIHAKGKGYIRKSELEILVEEAEKDYDTYVNNFIDIESDDRNELIEDMYKTIQALKKSHPEFTK